jgi:D-beta-D-heptose 7-phosphate kinase / D-beta-D-heptose 1-phosphate adenosyltransferase
MSGRRSSAPLVVVGDAFLDIDIDGRAERLCPDAPAPVIDDCEDHHRPGGAALAASMAAADGHDVVLVTTLVDDEPGRRLRHLLDAAGVEVVPLAAAAPGQETGQKVRIRASGHVVARVDRGGARTEAVPSLDTAARLLLQSGGVVLASDYGRGIADHRELRNELAIPRVGRHVVWDPHPRGPAPTPGTLVVTPNEREAAAISGRSIRSLADAVRAAAQLTRQWDARAVAVTRGAGGAVLVQGAGTPLAVPAIATTGDTCGAGDRFATSLALELGDGAVLSEAVVAAVVAAGEYVRAGGAETLRPRRADVGVALTRRDPVAEARARGGTVVATGGCFDLLHAGHVQLLQRARQLGDVLVVLLNSDRSVRELKGPGRPIVAAPHRAAVLQALGCVDAVVQFDEPTPEAALARLQPELFVKGGDYGADELPEQAVMSRWGGQCVVLPYLDGHSTTTLCEEVTRRGLA